MSRGCLLRCQRCPKNSGRTQNATRPQLRLEDGLFFVGPSKELQPLAGRPAPVGVGRGSQKAGKRGRFDVESLCQL